MITTSEISYGIGKDSCATQGTYEIRTPHPKPQPRINGPLVYGCRPGNPFLYRIPCQGKRPIIFSAKGLPTGLVLDPATGIITGTNPPLGEYIVTFKAMNNVGRAERQFKIVSGKTLSLTPPMGWNHWYTHEDRITDSIMREAADLMIKNGMADVGYQYVNIDGCWTNNPKKKDPTRNGPQRDEQGNILPNSHFPDMKSLVDYIHSKGLKAGIYSSPGPFDCAGYAGSYEHEEQDAHLFFAVWGFDFLKYDWCSYEPVRVAGQPVSLEEMQKPYILMGDILKRQPRDVVFNLCQYGMGKVWEWGAKVGGQSWRTAGDISFESEKFFAVALKNAEHGAFSGPGAWNDPDYLVLGRWSQRVGNVWTKDQPNKMTPDEQYSYMSLWCLMASPLFLGGDIAQLDEFTLNVLCNPEVIDVDQDPLGKSGKVIRKSEDCFLMVKDMADGSKAVGLFNQSKNAAELVVDWKELQISGKQSVRDLWRQKELGVYKQKFSAQVPPRGVVMVKISKR
ncbi:MAG: putative Ig domain-containing protein [Peptostreptococcaceae bacterium]|nr:putative Ig domain-containing protein [Peptostreptococcaceae bacterium]